MPPLRRLTIIWYALSFPSKSTNAPGDSGLLRRPFNFPLVLELSSHRRSFEEPRNGPTYSDWSYGTNVNAKRVSVLSMSVKPSDIQSDVAKDVPFDQQVTENKRLIGSSRFV